jgi:Ankyrin repeats (3 copies)/Ankyrin repeat
MLSAALLVALAVAPQPPLEAPPEPLLRAAFRGELEALDAELAKGVPVELKGAREWTALHWATLGGRAEAVRHLLSRGADPDARGQFDLTPLHWAALRGDEAVASALIARGARLEARDLYGMTPLHLVATEGLVTLLAQAGAKLDQRENDGMTPLLTSRTKETGQALLKHGAELHARSRDGRTLFDMLVVNTLEPRGLMLYGRRSAGRLRGDSTSVAIRVRNVWPVPLLGLSLRARSEAATASEPPTLERLAPGQQVSSTFTLTRRPEVAEGNWPLLVTVFLQGAQVGTFELEMDTDRGETPTDQGMVRLGQARLKPTGSGWYELAFLTVPLLLLGGWLLARRRRGRAL